jgi:hypothetical protein
VNSVESGLLGVSSSLFGKGGGLSVPDGRSLPTNGFAFVGGGDGVVVMAVVSTLRRLAVPPSGKSTWPEPTSHVRFNDSFTCRKMQFGRVHVSVTGQSTDLNAEEVQANMVKCFVLSESRS